MYGFLPIFNAIWGQPGVTIGQLRVGKAKTGVGKGFQGGFKEFKHKEGGDFDKRKNRG